MQFLRRNKSRSLLGIDISATHIHLAELTYTQGKYMLRNAAQAPRSANTEPLKTWGHPTIINELKQILSTIKPRSNRVAIALPRNTVLCRNLELDARLSKTEIFQYLLAHAERLFNFPAAALVIDFAVAAPIAKESDQSIPICCVAAKRTDVSLCQQITGKLGLNLILVDIDENALQRIAASTLALTAPSTHSIAALLYCSINNYSLLIFNQQSLLHSQQEPIAAAADETAQYESISQTFIRNLSIQGFGQAASPMTRIFLTGTLATEKLATHIQQQTAIPCEILNPFASLNFEYNQDTLTAASQFALSIGLAMRVKS